MKYKRVLLKLSGEALAGDDHFGINANTVADIARQNQKKLKIWVLKLPSFVVVVIFGVVLLVHNGYGTFFC